MAFMAAAAPIAGLVGAGVSATGTIEGGEATSNAAAYQAQVAKNNAIIAEQNATYASNAGLASATMISPTAPWLLAARITDEPIRPPPITAMRG